MGPRYFRERSVSNEKLIERMVGECEGEKVSGPELSDEM